jgi:hypothetical protein
MIGRAPGTNQELAIHRREELKQAEVNEPRVHHDIQARADAKGHFAFDRVPPGKVSVACGIRTDLGGGRASVSYSQATGVLAEAGKTSAIQLGGKGRPVVGRVALPAELPSGWVFAFNHLSSKIDMPKAEETKADA